MDQYPNLMLISNFRRQIKPLNSQIMQSLRDQFDVTEESDDFGIEMYLNVKRYVEHLIA